MLAPVTQREERTWAGRGREYQGGCSEEGPSAPVHEGEVVITRVGMRVRIAAKLSRKKLLRPFNAARRRGAHND